MISDFDELRKPANNEYSEGGFILQLNNLKMKKLKPVNTEYDKHKGGEEIAPGPDHHKNLASHVPSVPLQKKHWNCFFL